MEGALVTPTPGLYLVALALGRANSQSPINAVCDFKYRQALPFGLLEFEDL